MYYENLHNRPWAIRGDSLRQLVSIARTFDLKAMANKPAGDQFSIVDGVAIINVSGILVKTLSMFAPLFGERSMQDIGRDFQAAVDDPNAKAVILSVDSPGGSVDGTSALANQISAARGKKPIIAVADGIAASAAYWVAAAADAIYITGPTTEVGSIGVVAVHRDISEQDKMYGEQFTEIVAGKFKRIASVHKPLSDEGREYLQEKVNEVYSVMVENIATLRGTSIPRTLEMADGKLFMGQAAVDVGLVDGIMSMDKIIKQAAKNDWVKPLKNANFEGHVFDLVKAGRPQHDAFRAIKEAHPGLYADFTRRLQTGGSIGELFPGQNRGRENRI
jgi:signal peptide peptidase SppA